MTMKLAGRATGSGSRNTRWKLVSAAAAALMLLLGVFLTGCSSSAKPSTARASTSPQAIPVSVATAKKEDMPVYLVGLGSVTPLYQVAIKSRVDGQLMRVDFKEGQKVNKGDLLAVIDPRPYEVVLSQAQAQLFKDQASLRDAKLNLDRFQALLKESGAISQQQVDTQRSTVDQFEGAVRTDQAAIDNAKLNLTYCHITSPISGRVGLRLVDPGNMVHASDTNALMIIAQQQPITVIFNLPEDQLPAVSKRMKGARLPVEAYSRDLTQKLATGYLTSIDNQIDQTTGTGKLKAEFTNTHDELWPNQFVNIQLLLEQRPNTTVIPAAAVQRGPDGTFVYSVKQDSTVQMQPVTVALTQNNQAAIAQGVQPGDVVVTDGQDKLQNGMKIEARTGGPRGGGANPATGAGASGQNSAAASPGAMPGGSQAASSSPVMGEQQTPSGGTVGQVGSNPAVSTARPTTQSGEERRNQPQQGSGIR